MRSVAAYLEGELLPRRLIDMMMSKPSNDIYWLTEQDLADIGDYPPEVEEYLIRKCGYDRNYISKVIEARNRGDSTTARKLLDQSNRAQVCTSQATSEAQEATLLKLRSGWLPY